MGTASGKFIYSARVSFVIFSLIFLVTEIGSHFRLSAAVAQEEPLIPQDGQTDETENGQSLVTSNFDSDAPPETRIRIAPFLTFGAQLELEYNLGRNFDLNGAEDEDISTIEPGLSLAFSFDPNRYFQAFFVSKLSEVIVFEDGDKVEDDTSLELEQAYFLFKNLFDDRLALQVGRQRFEDTRQWLYDEELDAARVFYRLSNFLLELSVSREMLVDRDFLNDDTAERVDNYIAYGTYALDEEIEIAAYVFARDDRLEEDESPVFFGLHSDGEVADGLEYWVELAHVRGKDGSSKIRGFGFDVGSAYEFDLPLTPFLTAGYAFGTGDDDPDDEVDKSFRQTGLQNNEDDFKYYGELFDPELGNLSIFTAGAGVKPTEESFFALVYHYYLQHKASDELRGAAIDADPTGLSKNLGSEIDLILIYEQESERLELLLSLGYFIPGSAFPSESENGFSTRLEIQFNF